MVNMLGHQVGKTVLVSMPSLFDNGRLLPCRVLGIEISGLWLQSEKLMNTLAPDVDVYRMAKIFVTFTQIAFLIEQASVRAPAVTPKQEAARPAPAQQHKPKKSRSSQRDQDNRSAQR